jgi:soluble lytic murein transglycosylase
LTQVQDFQVVKTRKRAPVKLILIIAAALVAISVFAASIPGLRNLIFNPAEMFTGDDTLSTAAKNLNDADNKLKLLPNDESAHLARAKAYLEFGYLEGARLEFDSKPKKADPEWDKVGQILNDLENKTDKIRSMMDDAEGSPNPSEKYQPIYNLLDDLALNYQGVPKYRTLFMKGYLLLREGRKSEAEPIFADQLKHYVPLQAYVTYNHARSLMVAGSEDKALKEFDRFIEENPSDRLAPLVYLEKINMLRDLNRSEDALAECRKAIDAYPSSPFAAKTLRKWAEIYESAMDFDNGAQIRIRILADYPESDEATDTRSKFFGGVYDIAQLAETDQLEVSYAAANSNPSNTLSLLTKLSDSPTLNAEQRARAAQGASLCQYRLGKFYESIALADKAIGLAPDTIWSDRAGIRKGHSFKKLDKADLAKQAYLTVAQAKGPLASTAGEILWQYAYDLSDMAMVAQACKIIVDNHPSSSETPQAMTVLAYLGCRSGQYQSGRAYAEKCIRAFPTDPASAEAGYWLAEALDGLSQNAQSVQSFTTLAKRAPWCYWGIRASERVNRPMNPLVAVDPFNFDVTTSSVYKGNLAVAWELYDAGALDLAESEFRQADDNREGGAQCGLAMVLAEGGNYQSSVPIFRSAALAGDQVFLTPYRQSRVIAELYPTPYYDEVSNAILAHNVPPSWLWAAMREESCFNERAHSPSGACGLIQIMPETGRFIASQMGAKSFDPSSLWNPATNLDYAAWYFDYLRSPSMMGDNLLLVMAAYNGGPGRVGRWHDEFVSRDDDIFISSMPKTETRNYAHQVYANVRIYDSILKNKKMNPAPF